MIIALRLKNFVLIESIEIFFQKGLTVFTGESGSGKSLIFESLDSLFAGDSIQKTRLVRPGTRECIIQADFKLNNELITWMDDNSIFYEGEEITVSRQSVLRENRLLTKYRINGSLINKNLLLSLRGLLIDFSFQGQANKYDSSIEQLLLIDKMKSKNLINSLREVELNYENWFSHKKKLDHLLNQQKSNKERMASMEADYNILFQANLSDINEIDHLKKEELLLANSKNINDSLKYVLNKLTSNHDHEPAEQQIVESIKALQRISAFDDQLNHITNECLSINDTLLLVINNINSYLDGMQSIDVSLDSIQERIHSLTSLETKYSLNLSELIRYRDDISKQLITLSASNDLSAQKTKETKLRLIRDQSNEQLSRLRKKNALFLENEITNLLKKLSLPNVRFKVSFEMVDPSRTGIDMINFLFSANPDIAMAPLTGVISGGEMSRFLLALKVVTLGATSNTLMCFDEIDTGLSGKSLETVLKLLKTLSCDHQIFCITHNPLIAASADHHYKVRKSVLNNVTSTNVTHLSSKLNRCKELVEIIGGPNDMATEYALRLLEDKVA